MVRRSPAHNIYTIHCAWVQLRAPNNVCRLPWPRVRIAYTSTCTWLEWPRWPSDQARAQAERRPWERDFSAEQREERLARWAAQTLRQKGSLCKMTGYWHESMEETKQGLYICDRTTANKVQNCHLSLRDLDEVKYSHSYCIDILTFILCDLITFCSVNQLSKIRLAPKHSSSYIDLKISTCSWSATIF